MDLFRYIVRFLYKIRWYLIILPLIALIVAWFSTRHMERVYDANTTIYTGMITAYNLEGGSGVAGGNYQSNMANLMIMITTDNTIHEVALRLFGRCMMYGNPNKDNNYISAEHFRQLSAGVPAEVKALINHNSEQITYAILKAYERPTQDNYLFGFDTEIINEKSNEFECIYMNLQNKNKTDILNNTSLRTTIVPQSEQDKNNINNNNNINITSLKEKEVLKSTPNQCSACSYTMNAYSCAEDEEKTLGQNILSFLEEAKSRCDKCGDSKLNHTSFIYKNNEGM